MFSMRNTVVFDIDDTLCTKHTKENWEMCPDLELVTISKGLCQNLHHAFFNHYNILFDYLLHQNCYIAFFSQGVEERNQQLIVDYFTLKYGKDRYDELVSQGQFKVYSRHHMTKVKDLTQILRSNQTIDNIILVDDNPLNAAKNQKEMISVSVVEEPNVVARLLGLFMSYFEEHQTLSLRKFIGSIDLHKDFVRKGLQEIRKTVPMAGLHVAKGKDMPLEEIPPRKQILALERAIRNGKLTAENGNLRLLGKNYRLYFESYYNKKRKRGRK